MKLYLDLDEVCFESIKSVLRILNNRYGTNVQFDDVKSWNFDDCFPNMTSEEIEDIFNSKEFFDDLEFKEGCIDFINWYIKEHGAPNITFVTKGNGDNIFYKRMFLRNYFPEITIIPVDLDDKKSNYTQHDAILVDDSQSNLVDSNCKVNVLFLNSNDAEWNKGYSGLQIASFSELKILIEHFITGLPKNPYSGYTEPLLLSEWNYIGKTDDGNKIFSKDGKFIIDK